jgi:alkylation response protein AidB-like acyl-CoA dehydrogenase
MNEGMLSPPEVLTRARALTPVLRERSAAANAARRIQDETIRDLLEAGLFRLLQPRAHGGVEHDLETFARVVMQLSRGCGSAGWVFSVVSIHQWMVGLFPGEAQHDVWGRNREALVASALRPGQVAREPGGYRLTGRWSFASGCDNCQWIIVQGVCGVSGTPPRPDVKLFLVPLADGRIHDDWHVTGLRGTGSKTVVIEGAFVPGHRALDFFAAREGEAPGREANSGPLYRLPAFANFPVCLAAPAVGTAWGAYERFIAYLEDRTSIARRRLAEFPTVQMRAAEASGLIDAAELLLLRDCRDAMDCASAGRAMTMAQRARARRDHGYACRSASEAVEKLLRACGAAGLAEDFEIQRCYRAIYAMASHIGTNWDAAATQSGQVAFGLEMREPVAWI